MKSQRYALFFLALYSLSTMGCNILSGMDSPTVPLDIYSAAVAKADEGKCEEARDLLVAITAPDDKIRIALGWAYLCTAGATASTIAGSLYKYTSASTDLTIIGGLARSLIPFSSDKSTAITNAINTFRTITDTQVGGLQVAIAQFVQAAGILSDQAINVAGTDSLTRGDVGPSACVVANCATNDSVGCTATGGMSDVAVNRFITAVDSAATALGSSNAKELKALAAALQSGVVGGGTTARCYIYNNTIPAS